MRNENDYVWHDHFLRMPGLKAICLQPVWMMSLWSGRRESNPVFTNPNRTYYRYTTARIRTSSANRTTTGLPRSQREALRYWGILRPYQELHVSAQKAPVHLVGFEPTTFRM